MASIALPNDVVNYTTGDARPMQANFVALETHINASLVHVDGSRALTGALTLPGAPTADLHAATKAYVDLIIPVGTIVDFAGAAAPSGWALCAGGSYDPVAYPLLKLALNDVYGVNLLPDLRSRFVVGKGTATWSDALAEAGGSADAVAVAHTHGTPNHDHSWSGTTSSQGAHDHSSGLLMQGKTVGGWTNETRGADFGGNRSGDVNVSIGTDGAHQHTVGGTTGAANPSTNSQSPSVAGTNQNLPPYITLNKIIRLG